MRRKRPFDIRRGSIALAVLRLDGGEARAAARAAAQVGLQLRLLRLRHVEAGHLAVEAGREEVQGSFAIHGYLRDLSIRSLRSVRARVRRKFTVAGEIPRSAAMSRYFISS